MLSKADITTKCEHILILSFITGGSCCKLGLVLSIHLIIKIKICYSYRFYFIDISVYQEKVHSSPLWRLYIGSTFTC